MLSDRDILAELHRNGGQGSGKLVSEFPLDAGVDWNSLPPSASQWNESYSPIQASSVDLHVGRIFVPGEQPGALGGEGNGALSYTLKPGSSVIVSTYERICLPASLGGIVFPPSKLSSSGILVANIGHIDPGFEGRLRFTIINMGASDFALIRGTVAVGTLLLFSLNSASCAPWPRRHSGSSPKGEPGKAEIDAIAKDFADVGRRIDSQTRASVNRLQGRFSLWAVLIPLLIGIALGFAAIWFESGRSLSDRIERNEEAIAQVNVEQARLGAIADPRAEDLDRELAKVRAELAETRAEITEMRGQIPSLDALGKRK